MTASRQAPNHVWHKAFVKVLSTTGNVTLAARHARVGRATAYEARRSDPQFAAAWDEAIETACDLLEAEAWRRAVEGWVEPVFGRVGKDTNGEIGSIRRYSDPLLIQLLKAHRPAKYREHYEVKHITLDAIEAEIELLLREHPELAEEGETVPGG